jgi:hypothetical protein
VQLYLTFVHLSFLGYGEFSFVNRINFGSLSLQLDEANHFSFHLICRWGIGHSAGLLLVGSIFIIKDYIQYRNGSEGNNDNPVDIPDSVGHFFETLVGCFMLGLGVYGFRTAFKKRREMNWPELLQSEDGSAGDYNDDDNNITNPTTSLEEPSRYRDQISTGRVDPEQIIIIPSESLHDEDPEGVTNDNCSQNALEVDSNPGYHDNTQIERTGRSFFDWTRRLSTKTLAFLAGIVHGLAGPGGVLGVIPAVQLHDWKLATCYLGSFCISSTLTMGVFACTYGTLSTLLGRKTNWEFQIQCFSSTLSILVGVTWLVLLSLGKLEDVFP